uniref:Methyltransferase-like protein 5 n=1 Tax=Xenopsylla cheopis TaxID=163159 RepID=A0A6M2DEZ5_XENCH
MGTCMKLRELEEWLQGCDVFEKPKILLEQYPTLPHIASHMLHAIQSQYGDIEGKLVADLGSGCGSLSIGCCLLQSALTVGFEIDPDAIAIHLNNVNEMEIESYDIINCDVLTDVDERWNCVFDTVVLNPPFGTKHNAGIDIKFLQTALRISNSSVYSLHKTSTRAHLLKKAKEWNVEAKVIAQLRYDLPSTYRFHKKTSVDIDVDLIQFKK